MLLLLLFMCWCGAINGSPANIRIIRGNPLNISEAPYQVSIYKKSDDSHICGGSIISPHFVLTAAHCVDSDDKPAFFRVRVGSTYWHTRGALHQVVRIFVHEDYDETDIGVPYNDVALFKVQPAFKFNNSSVKIVDLFDLGENVKAGAKGLLSGWGATEKGKTPKHLMGLKVNVLSNRVCNKNYKDYGGLGDGQICATSPEGLRDFCWGDSGGPLVIEGRQVGLVSYSGPGCAEKGRPGVYTEVAYFRDWIDKHIKKDKKYQDKKTQDKKVD